MDENDHLLAFCPGKTLAHLVLQFRGRAQMRIHDGRHSARAAMCEFDGIRRLRKFAAFAYVQDVE
jgi:hypothetical protein